MNNPFCSFSYYGKCLCMWSNILFVAGGVKQPMNMQMT